MEFVPSIEIDRRTIAEEGPDHARMVNVERLIQLSSWMMVLGTIRLICAFTDYLSAFVEASRFEPISRHMLGRFVDENHPILALCAAWPLLLAIALRRTRWPQLLPAASATFLILAFGGVMESTAGWNHARGEGVTFGPFHVTRRAFLHPTLSDVTLGLLGTGQLLLEGVTAIRCLLLAHRFRRVQPQPAECNKQSGSRKARFGRLAFYASLGFLVVMIRLPVWSTYLELLNESTIVREFVLRNDIRRSPGRMRSFHQSKEGALLFRLNNELNSALRAAQAGQFAEAKEAYLGIISQVGSSYKDSPRREFSSVIAEAHNNLAWLLATYPKDELREPQAAVEHARLAIESDPGQGTFWNTLGVAYYRAGEIDEAKRALHRAMELRNEGDSFDWFFLALVHLKQGRRDDARQWYDKAVKWYQRALPFDRELYRFHVEAAHELGLTQPPRPPPVPAFPQRRRL
jgi:tetratricopeptide (TPR) repeat protein